MKGSQFGALAVIVLATPHLPATFSAILAVVLLVLLIISWAKGD